MFAATDTNKDQTYFLYRITADALSKTLFPLDEYTKPQIRELAAQKNLVTATKRDSQGICFVGSVGIKDFLSQYVTAKVGDIIDQSTEKVVGRHDGAIFYTLGQRHGLDVGGGLPYYVVSKDMDRNIVYVSQNLKDESMWRSKILLSDVHWIGAEPEHGTNVQVRMRHRGELLPAIYEGSGSLKLNESERAVASGQSAVIYRGDRVLGGGFVL